MARTCQVTERTPGFGNHVSHSHRRTKMIDKRGIEAVVADLRRQGVSP